MRSRSMGPPPSRTNVLHPDALPLRPLASSTIFRALKMRGWTCDDARPCSRSRRRWTVLALCTPATPQRALPSTTSHHLTANPPHPASSLIILRPLRPRKVSAQPPATTTTRNPPGPLPPCPSTSPYSSLMPDARTQAARRVTPPHLTATPNHSGLNLKARISALAFDECSKVVQQGVCLS